jgi:hypothetical protein
MMGVLINEHKEVLLKKTKKTKSNIKPSYNVRTNQDVLKISDSQLEKRMSRK